MSFEVELRRDFARAEASLPAGGLSFDAVLQRAGRSSVRRIATFAVAASLAVAGGFFVVDAVRDGIGEGGGTPPAGGDVQPVPTDDTDDPTPGDGRYSPEATTGEISVNAFTPPAATKDGDCSAAADFSRLQPVGDQAQVLSPEAAAMRRDIIAAAWLCDLDRLQELAWGREPVGAFSYTPTDIQMKASPAEAWGLWERQGREVLAKLIFTLETEPTVLKGAPDGVTYVWPNVRLAQDFPEEFPYRVSIDDSGDWRSFRPADG